MVHDRLKLEGAGSGNEYG